MAAGEMFKFGPITVLNPFGARPEDFGLNIAPGPH